MKFRGIAVAAIIALSFPLQSVAEEDPFPGVEYQAEIPGTRIESSPGATNDEWNNSEAMRNHTCPEGSGRAIGVDLRGTATSTDNIRFAYCIKTWRPQSVLDAWDQYYRDLRAAQDAAADESRRWNEANPGKQKCVQWGPITSPDGGQSSGGVCANPVPAGTAPSGSESVDAPSVGEGDISGGSSSSPSTGASAPEPTPSPSEPASTESSSTTSTTSSSPVASGSAPDPTPSGGVDYRGNGYPFTHIVEGQVGVAGCPVGFQAANGLIVDVSARKTYTECWPLRAWTANRLGGESWELFKATGGTYDPTVEVERREKVALLKAKAKEVAEAAARNTPGIERCSSWSGFGESGRECAYAFVAPSSSSSPVGSGSSTNSPAATESQVITVISATSSQQVIEETAGASSSPTSSSDSATGSVAVGLETVAVAGTSVEIARTALAITSDPIEAQSISALATNITAVPTVIRSATQNLPRMTDVSYKVVSLTPNTCKASTWRVRVSKPGLCQVEFQITDSEGNSYDIVKKIRRRS